MRDPFEVWERWLKWLDSPEGKKHRRSAKPKGEGKESDLICTIPNPPGSAIVTMRDLRELVKAGRRLKKLEK